MSGMVEVTGVWLRRIGDHAEVLVEVGGTLRLVIRERVDGSFSHIAEASGIKTWPHDTVAS